MRDKLRNLCRDLGLQWTAHDSHGFYIDVFVAGRELWIDPTPERVWREGVCIKSWPNGTCFVRDRTASHERPTHLAEFNLSTQDGYDKLRVFLTDGVPGSTAVSSIPELAEKPDEVAEKAAAPPPSAALDWSEIGRLRKEALAAKEAFEKADDRLEEFNAECADLNADLNKRHDELGQALNALDKAMGLGDREGPRPVATP
jgi:hypothetical protein